MHPERARRVVTIVRKEDDRHRAVMRGASWRAGAIRE